MSWKFLDTARLRDIDLFQNLSDRALNEVLGITNIVSPKGGEFVFREGDPGDGLYLILDGEVRISKDIATVGEEALAFLKPGQYFGEMALLQDDSTRSAHAIAGGMCRLAKIDRKDFLSLLERDKDIAVEVLWQFVATLSKRLRASNDKIAFFALSTMFE